MNPRNIKDIKPNLNLPFIENYVEESDDSNEYHDELADNFKEIARLEDGKSFGELALIVAKPRMATIRCECDSHFAILEKKDF